MRAAAEHRLSYFGKREEKLPDPSITLLPFTALRHEKIDQLPERFELRDTIKGSTLPVLSYQPNGYKTGNMM